MEKTGDKKLGPSDNLSPIEQQFIENAQPRTFVKSTRSRGGKRTEDRPHQHRPMSSHEISKSEKIEALRAECFYLLRENNLLNEEIKKCRELVAQTINVSHSLINRKPITGPKE